MRKSDPTDPKTFENASATWEALTAALELSMLVRMMKGVKEATGTYTSVSWAVAVAEMRTLTEALKAQVPTFAIQTVEKCLSMNDVWAKSVGEFSSWKNYGYLSKLATLRSAKLANDVTRLFNFNSLYLQTTTGYKPISLAYDILCSSAHNSIATGATTYDRAIRAAADFLTSQKGIKLYYNGRHYDIYGAVRQNVIDDWQGTVQDYRDSVGDRLGMDAIEVSAHSGCAEDHLPYQGRIYTRIKFNELQDSLERPLGMWNCRHIMTPCWADSTPSYSKAELRRMAKESAGIVTVGGREMSVYDATQWQRGMERKIRKAKMSAQIYDEAGLKTEASQARTRAREYTSLYKDGSAEAGLPTDARRTRVGRLG